MDQVYIVSAARTPIGRFGGGLARVSPVDLAAHAMQAAQERAGIPGEALDLYVMGNVLRAGHGQLLPRQAALKAGIPEQVNGYALDMVCASGMMSLINTAHAIWAQQADLVLAGGVESMSQTGFYLSHRARWGYKFLLGAQEQLVDILEQDGLTDSTRMEGMGEQTERLASVHGFTRQELDEVAFSSQQRAAVAARETFSNEIAPIEVNTEKGSQLLAEDEGIRPNTTVEKLAKLRPVFKSDGVITAGNSSQLSDGAAALILASQSAVERYGLKPMAKLLGGAWEGGETWRFPEYPIYAVKKLLAKLEMNVSDFDLFENNEAFAVSNLLFTRMLQVSEDKLNVNGGAIALGHPIGASGARIVTTLLNALRVQDKTLGIAAVCHGTGGGTAIAIERL